MLNIIIMKGIFLLLILYSDYITITQGIKSLVSLYISVYETEKHYKPLFLWVVNIMKNILSHFVLQNLDIFY